MDREHRMHGQAKGAALRNRTREKHVLSEPLSTKLGLASNGDIGDKQHMEEGTNSLVGKRLKTTTRGIAKEWFLPRSSES